MSTSISAFDMISEETQSLVRYPSDLLDEEWEILQPIINELEPYTTGRPRTTDLRDILNAIFYLNKTGCPWRYLPQDFPSYKLVNYYYNNWRQKKAGIRTPQQQLLTVKASREPLNLIWNRGSTVANSLK